MSKFKKGDIIYSDLKSCYVIVSTPTTSTKIIVARNLYTCDIERISTESKEFYKIPSIICTKSQFEYISNMRTLYNQGIIANNSTQLITKFYRIKNIKHILNILKNRSVKVPVILRMVGGKTKHLCVGTIPTVSLENGIILYYNLMHILIEF